MGMVDLDVKHKEYLFSMFLMGTKYKACMGSYTSKKTPASLRVFSADLGFEKKTPSLLVL